MLLPYCVALHSSESKNLTGVREAEVKQLAIGALHCYYSRYESFLNPSAQDGLQFHEVVSKIFAQGTLIQFRFPMLLDEESELREHLAAHAREYESFLRTTRELVQMDLQFTSSAKESNAASGAEYLRARSLQQKELERAAAAARSAVGQLATDWREAVAQTGKFSCYSLVKRDDATKFREQLRALKVGPQIKLSITGPWPPMQFFEAKLSA